MRKKLFVRALAALAGGSVLAATGVAGAAQQTCTYGATTIGDANTVFINGSSAVKSLLQHLAYVLYEEGVYAQGAEDGGTVDLSKITKIVYQSTASCQGVNDLVGAMSDTAGPSYLDGSLGTLASPVAGVETCAIPTTEATFNVDIGASDVYPATCGVTALPAGMSDFDQGAVQVMEIAVPAGSADFSITADAAYVVFGWGGTGMYTVGPWTDSTNIFIRTLSPLSGTEGMIASAIGLVPSKWLATLGDAGAAQMLASSGTVESHLQNSSNAAAAIGILSAAVVDPNKGAPVLNDASVVTGGGLRPLAFQANGQDCGYYPDSTASAFDKINVRQGRYAIWGAHHWIVNVADGGGPVGVNGNSAAVATVIAHLMHASSLPSEVTTAMITAEAETYDVPACAMQVSRSAEVTSTGTSGGEMSYQPAMGCGCFYESIINKGTPISSYCKPCGGADAGSDAGSCSGAYPVCNFGYCEVQ